MSIILSLSRGSGGHACCKRTGFGIQFALPSRTGVPPVFAARTVFAGRKGVKQGFLPIAEGVEDHAEAFRFTANRPAAGWNGGDKLPATTPTPAPTATPTETPRIAVELLDLQAAAQAARSGERLPEAALALPGVAGQADPEAALMAQYEAWQAQAGGVWGALEAGAEYPVSWFRVAVPNGPDENLIFAQNPETGETALLTRLTGDAGQEVRQEINGLWSGRVVMGEGGTFAEAEFYYLLDGREVAVMRWNGQNFVFIGNDGTEMVLPGISFRLGRNETQGAGGLLALAVPEGEGFYESLRPGWVIDLRSGLVYDDLGREQWGWDGREYLVFDEYVLRRLCYYGREEIAGFATIDRREIRLNGRAYQALVGVEGSGREQVLAAEMTTYEGEQVWTRISIGDLPGDNGQMVIWINPRQDGSIQVNSETARLFWGALSRYITAGGQGAAVYNMTGGQMTLELPYALYSRGGYRVRWVEDTLDLREIEIVLIQSLEKWQALARNFPQYAEKVYSTGSYGHGLGATVMPRDGGGSLVVVPNFDWDAGFAPVWRGEFRPVGINNIEEARDGMEEYFGPWLYVSLETLAYRREGEMAFQASVRYEFPETEGSFDYMTDGFLKYHELIFGTN